MLNLRVYRLDSEGKIELADWLEEEIGTIALRGARRVGVVDCPAEGVELGAAG